MSEIEAQKILLEKAAARLKELDVPYISLDISRRHGKKLKVVMLIDGVEKALHFGSEVSTTHLEEPNESKRALYHARADLVRLKDGRFASSVKYTPAWFARHVLW